MTIRQRNARATTDATTAAGVPDEHDATDPLPPVKHRVPARGVQTTWTYTLGSIVFIYIVLDALALLTSAASYSATSAPLDAALVLLVLVSAAIHVRYCWFLRVGRGGGMPHPAWTFALIVPAAAAWVVGLLTPGGGLIGALPLWMAVTLIAALVAKRLRWMLLGVGFLLTVAHGILAVNISGSPVVMTFQAGSGDWLLVVYSVTLPIMVLSSLWWWEIVVTLDRHRSVAADLAVAQERLRFASDLHDIQGHHLQVIALKSELAERLLSVDADAARDLVHETRLIAREALEETRSLVAGYREVALDDELENAREVLAAAGAQCELAVEALPADPEIARTLALVVREATTNILRHSDATEASIHLGATNQGSILVISNNKATGADASGRAASTGLAGLRDRVLALHGSLDTTIDGDRFELRVVVPTRGGLQA
ncbi:two-component system sensor histidine kinase DesK [Mycetocola sp. CAN_C7]|uniref:sensor histidine kinase n=1 Tax=Mycetocola sp. CAN_C7 TaxID=2787724 RepID=UPI0018C923B5